MIDQLSLAAELAKLDLDEEETQSYVLSLLEVDSASFNENDEEEVVDALFEFLYEASEEESLAKSVTDALVALWKEGRRKFQEQQFISTKSKSTTLTGMHLKK